MYLSSPRISILKWSVAPLLLLFGVTLSAADRYVDPANVCGGNLPCYTTIQAAVTASLTGDVIHVGPGAYPETVTINESLTLLGAQATVNPNGALWNDTRTIVANESVIQGPVNLSLRNDIVIDGFTIERSAANEGHILIGSGNATGVGASSSFRIANTRFVGSRSTAPSWAGIHTNFLSDNTLPGAQFVSDQNRITIAGTASGSGILINANLPGTDNLGSTTITGTYVESAPGNGFNVNRPGGSALISGNRLVTDDIFTFRANNTVITDNVLTDSPQAAISNTGGSATWSASNNTITNPRAQAFLVGSTFTVDPVSAITIEDNTITVDPSLIAVSVGTVFSPFQYAYFDMRGNLTGTNTIEGNDLSFNSNPLNPAVVAVYGVRVRGVVGNLTVSDNGLAGNAFGGLGTATLPPSSAVFVDTETVTSALDLHIENNILTGWRNGATVSNGVTGTAGGLPAGATVILSRNDLSANPGFGVQNGTGEVVVATCNWWGAADGPGPVGTGSGVQVTTNVTFTPFLSTSNLSGGCVADAGTSTVDASPTSVPADGTTTSTITVTLRDSGGNPVAGKTVILGANSGNVSVSAASGPSNASGVVTFTVSNNVAETVSFTANVTTDSVTLIDSASVTFTASNLTVLKSGAPDPVVAGSDITYTITVQNVGPTDATAVELTDLVPAGTTFVSTTQTSGPTFDCTNPPTLTCTIATLVSGASGVFELVVNVPLATAGGTEISNTATATTTSFDPVTPSSVTITTTVQGNANLTITKDASATNITQDDPLTYTIVVTNEGAGPATNVVVTDPLPAGMTATSATSTVGSCSGTTTITCNVGTLASLASATITIEVDASGAIGATSNTATATSPDDTTPGDNADAAAVVVGQAAAIPVAGPLGLALMIGLLAVGAAIALRGH